MSHLFDVLNSGGFAEFTVHVSLIEIYNEEIFDLLSTSSGIEKLKMYARRRCKQDKAENPLKT